MRSVTLFRRLPDFPRGMVDVQCDLWTALDGVLLSWMLKSVAHNAYYCTLLKLCNLQEFPILLTLIQHPSVAVFVLTKRPVN